MFRLSDGQFVQCVFSMRLLCLNVLMRIDLLRRFRNVMDGA